MPMPGARVVLLARARALTGDSLPADRRPVALVVLADRVRPDAADTLRYFAEQKVRVTVISGDAPSTVGAIASSLGLEGAEDPVDARTLPEDPTALADVLESHRVFGRVTPQQKRAMVTALQARGPHGRDDRRRRERRPRAEGRRHRDRDGHGRRRDPRRGAARPARCQLRRAPERCGGGAPGARQHRAHVQPVPDQDGLRDAAVARGRRGQRGVPVPAEAPDADRGAHDRDPVVLPRARAERATVPSGVRQARAPLHDPDGVPRGHRDLPGLLPRDPRAGRHDRSRRRPRR